MKKERIIHQNKGLIDFTRSGYNNAVATIQREIDALKDTGLKIKDDVLLDLMLNSGYKTKELAEIQIHEEADKFGLKAMKEQILDQLQPLLGKIEATQSNVKAAMYISSHSHSATLSAEYFTIKDLSVSLIDGLDDIITDAHTNYADTPEKLELLERAERMKLEIENFEVFLRKHGDVLRVVSNTNIFAGPLYGGDVLLVHTKGGKCNVEIQHHVFGMLNKKTQ